MATMARLMGLVMAEILRQESDYSCLSPAAAIAD